MPSKIKTSSGFLSGGCLGTSAYTFQVGPAPFRALLAPAVDWIMTGKTHQRFQRLAQFLPNRGNDIAAWQQDGRVRTSAPHCAEA